MINSIGNRVGGAQNRPLFSRYTSRMNNILANTEQGQKTNVNAILTTLKSVGNPSFVLIPNGRLFGVLYSEIPNNSTGNVTFTGFGNKTRYNSSGNIEQVKRNLVTYSEDFTNWTNFNSTSIISADTITAPNGTVTMDKIIAKSGTTTYRGISRSSINIGANTNAVFSVYAKAGEYTNLSIGDQSNGRFAATFNLSNGTLINTYGGTSNTSITNVGNGIYRVVLTASTTSVANVSLLLTGYPNSGATLNAFGAQFNGDNNSGIYLWGAQLEVGTNLTSYQPTTTDVNVPRIDYSFTGSTAPSLLLEPARTNYSLYSNDFLSGWTRNNMTVTPNQTNSLTGLNDATQFTQTTSTGSVLRYTTTAIASGTTITNSFYFKNIDLSTFAVQISDGYNGEIKVTYNVTGSSMPVYASNTTSPYIVNPTFKVTDAKNGWYKISNTYTLYSSPYQMTPSCLYVGSFGSGKSCLIYGSQLEVGYNSSSYIPTTTATVTRVAETIQHSSIYTNNFITSDGGTFYIKMNNVLTTTRQSTAFLGVGDSTAVNSGNSLRLAYPAGSSSIEIWKTVAGVQSSLYSTTTSVIKVAIKWNGTTADVFVNGTKVVSGTAFTTTNMENLYGSGDDAPKLIETIAFYSTPLTDAQCQTLTT